MGLSKGERHCSPRCEFFKCGQRALIFRKDTVYCRWADTNCTGPTCNYAICARGHLLPNGVCGLTVKRKTVEETEPEDVTVGVKMRLRGKVRQRLRDEDLF